jgi:signal peptide peptidase SppA
MIRYLNILLACAAEPLAIDEPKLRAVMGFLARKAAGEKIDFAVDPEFQARVTQRAEQLANRSQGTPAILPVYGVLAQRLNVMQEISGGTSMEQLGAQFRALLADPGVSAIILDFESPGGTVSGTAELGQEIFDSRGVKPIVAQVDSMAASAAYWLACQCDEIVVTPGGQAGSIGVYTLHEDISKMLENEGIATTMISAGKYKTEGNPYGPLGEEAAANMQSRIDQSYTAFVQAVSRGRGGNITPAVVNDRFGQGRMFGAEELVSRRMADRVATWQETFERFGGPIINPTAKAARDATAQRSQAAETMTTKLKAGAQLSPRELEHGLKGLVGLTNSEAERAVRQSFKGIALGDPGKPTEPAITRADAADLRRGLGDLSSVLIPKGGA